MTDRMEQVREMLKENPSDPFLNYALALEHEKLGEVQRSIELLNSIITSDPNYLGAYYKLGQLYEFLDETELARKTFEEGIELATRLDEGKTLKELKEALLNLEF